MARMTEMEKQLARAAFAEFCRVNGITETVAQEKPLHIQHIFNKELK